MVTGLAANDIGLACGGWTIDWQGKPGGITTGTTLLQGLEDLVDGNINYYAMAMQQEKLQLESLLLQNNPMQKAMEIAKISPSLVSKNN